MRIGDTEREVAISALGEHMSAGRLDIDEYGERSAQVTAAKTRGEVAALFSDLPEPRPTFGDGPAASAPPLSTPAPAPPRRMANQSTKVLAGLLPVVVIAAIVLFAATHIGIWFLLIPLFIVFGGFKHRGGQLDRFDRQRERMADRGMRHRDRMERHMDRFDAKISRRYFR